MKKQKATLKRIKRINAKLQKAGKKARALMEELRKKWEIIIRYKGTEEGSFLTWVYHVSKESHCFQARLTSGGIGGVVGGFSG